MGLLFIRFVFMNYYQTLNVVLKTCYVGQPVVSAKIKSLDWHQIAIKLNVSGFKLLETLCAIWYYLYDLALACNFTKSNTRPWVFFTLFKLYKWYQIVQRLTFIYIKKAGITQKKFDLHGRKFPPDLVTFTEEILNGKLHFLCSASSFHKCWWVQRNQKASLTNPQSLMISLN